MEYGISRESSQSGLWSEVSKSESLSSWLIVTGPPLSRDVDYGWAWLSSWHRAGSDQRKLVRCWLTTSQARPWPGAFRGITGGHIVSIKLKSPAVLEKEKMLSIVFITSVPLYELVVCSFA